MRGHMKWCKMGKYSWELFFWALLWGLFLPALSFGQEPSAAGNYYESELLRLTEISTRLGQLNELLRNELEHSKRNSSDLENRLTESKTELDRLRAELEVLQTSSTELRLNAETSLQELAPLKESLQKTETSLQNLELSFSTYKQEAEQELNRLEQSRNRYRLLLVIAGTLAISGWTAFGISLLF